jgi:hypothetical protein
MTEVVLDPVELGVRQPFQAEQFVACRVDRADDLVELELDRAGVPVLVSTAAARRG